ncbi:uncharacterized protein LOC109727029 isoform X2 [Ananas comosus]|uniref:Uncharacterized protein LOC109727029 isoform X2 n=1 Tax=Ananas comosus TaxID=4615 RepID=A0A6P5GXA3_ANACO|nr:uncharacterized protein LOC109727029 isoform X2 [Ananas comosus]
MAGLLAIAPFSLATLHFVHPLDAAQTPIPFLDGMLGRVHASPPRPSISPPRGSISPPGSESSRSFSITIKRPSGSENAAEVFVRTFCGSDSRYNARIVEVDSRVL